MPTAAAKAAPRRAATAARRGAAGNRGVPPTKFQRDPAPPWPNSKASNLPMQSDVASPPARLQMQRTHRRPLASITARGRVQRTPARVPPLRAHSE